MDDCTDGTSSVRNSGNRIRSHLRYSTYRSSYFYDADAIASIWTFSDVLHAAGIVECIGHVWRFVRWRLSNAACISLLVFTSL